MEHQITGTDLDVDCSCGWYNHDPRPGDGDSSATAHILREVAERPDLADEYEANWQELFR